jgi:hypothetical protein
MVNKNLKYNTIHLGQELEWLGQLLRARLQQYRQGAQKKMALPATVPKLQGTASVYGKFLESFELDVAERVVLLLGLLPAIQPHFIERLLADEGMESKQIPELGGVKGAHHSGVMATGETALFLLAGPDMQKRLYYSLFFSPRHKFHTKNILRLEEVTGYEPETSGVITISKEIMHALTSATLYQPLFNSQFPAKLLTTNYERADLILNDDTARQLDEIEDWLHHRNTLLHDWGFSAKINAGYKCLFYGPPGTGKSLATAVIGKSNDMPVYRIDLSMVISKYIGETEKNLSKIFDAAAGKNWILFFDEADALFGKRSQIQNANDRFANQEVSYLLMRMEEYDGLAILATNLKTNLDRAFLRRFQGVVHFGMPAPEKREQLWSKAFPKQLSFEKGFDMEQLARAYSLSGANIINAVRYACIRMLKNKDAVMRAEHIMEGIKRELSREAGLTGD